MLLRFLLTVEKCFAEIYLRGRQGFRPHGHGLDVFLERFGVFKSVLDGVVGSRLGICGNLSFLIVGKPRLFLLFACLSGSLHDLKGGISFRP